MMKGFHILDWQWHTCDGGGGNDDDGGVGDGDCNGGGSGLWE